MMTWLLFFWSTGSTRTVFYRCQRLHGQECCPSSSGFKTGPTDPQRAVILRSLEYKAFHFFQSISVAPAFGIEHTNTHMYNICICKYALYLHWDTAYIHILLWWWTIDDIVDEFSQTAQFTFQTTFQRAQVLPSAACTGTSSEWSACVCWWSVPWAPSHQG